MVASNTFLTPTKITREALRILNNKLHFANKVTRKLEDEYKKIGESVTVRLPNRFIVSDGKTRVNQDLAEPSVTVTMDKQKHVSWSWSSKDLTLTIEEYSKRYLEPAMNALANKIDYEVGLLAQDIPNLLGTPGTTPTTLAQITNVMRRMTYLAVPDDRCGIMDPYAFNGMISGDFKSMYSKKITEDAVLRGMIEMAGGMDIYESANIYNHHAGTFITGTDVPLIDASVWTPAAGDTTMRIKGWSAGQNGLAVLRKGDVFTVAGVYAVNPVSYEVTPFLRDFVVTADTEYTHADGYVLVSVAPTVIHTGVTGVTKPYATVNALPVDGATVTIRSGGASAYHPQSTFFHREAFALVTAKLDLPDSATWKARQSYNGMSIRIIKDYDSTNDEEIIRCDVLFGTKTLRRDLAFRLTS